MALIDVAAPLAFCAGWLRPRVYVSTEVLARLSESELRAVLAHEQHHEALRDPLRLAVSRVLCQALFFLPVLRLLHERYTDVTELTADAAALDAIDGAAAPLAAAMLAVATTGAGEVVGISPARVDSLLGQPRAWRLPRVLLIAALATLGALVALAWRADGHASFHTSLNLPIVSSQPCVLVLALVPVLACLGGDARAAHCAEHGCRRLTAAHLRRDERAPASPAFRLRWTSTIACSIMPRSSQLDLSEATLKRTLRTLILAGLGCSALVASAPATSSAQAPAPPGQSALVPADPVIAWNQFLLDLQATPGDQPATVHPTYDLAMVHTAIHDAVVSIDHSDRRYLVGIRPEQGASAAAAADAAAHDVLVKLYPAQRAAIDQQYATLLAASRPSTRPRASASGGRSPPSSSRCAPTTARPRRPCPSSRGPNAGDYQLTPPALTPPVFTHWSQVKPFLLRRANSSGPLRRRRSRARSTRRPSTRSRRSAPPRARRARPTRRRSACSGTRRSGRPGTASRRLSRSPTTAACRRTRARSERST